MGKYSRSQIISIVHWRDSGLSWSEVADSFFQAYGTKRSGDTLRKAYGKYGEAAREWVPERPTPRPKPWIQPKPTIERDSKNARILVIGDLHCPYQHRDAVAFLKALKEKYHPDRVIVIGDEVDKHAMSFHDSDPDLPSAGLELEDAIKCLQPIYEMFPDADVLESNHGSMVYRKGKHHGIPRAYLRDYGEVLSAPEGWVWHQRLSLTLPNGKRVFFHHGKSLVPGKLSRNMSMSTVEGHFHSRMDVCYWGNPDGLFFAAHTGCLINDKALAFHYNKQDVERPILGSLVIINGHPSTEPMILDENGRWIGRLK